MATIMTAAEFLSHVEDVAKKSCEEVGVDYDEWLVAIAEAAGMEVELVG